MCLYTILVLHFKFKAADVSNLSCCLQVAEGIKSRGFIMTQQICKAEITNLSVHTALSHSCNDFIKCVHINESTIGEGISIVKGVNIWGEKCLFALQKILSMCCSVNTDIRLASSHVCIKIGNGETASLLYSKGN